MKLNACLLARGDQVIDDGVIIGLIYYGTEEHAKQFRDWFARVNKKTPEHCQFCGEDRSFVALERGSDESRSTVAGERGRDRESLPSGAKGPGEDEFEPVGFPVA